MKSHQGHPPKSRRQACRRTSSCLGATAIVQVQAANKQLAIPSPAPVKSKGALGRLEAPSVSGPLPVLGNQSSDRRTSQHTGSLKPRSLGCLEIVVPSMGAIGPEAGLDACS